MNLANRPKKAGHGTGQLSVKTEGYVVQSVRMTVAANRAVRRAATKAGVSINSWAADVLREAATIALQKKRTNTNGKANS